MMCGNASIIGFPLGPTPGKPGEFVSNASPTNTPEYGQLSRSQKLDNAPTPWDILLTIDENSIHRF